MMIPKINRNDTKKIAKIKKFALDLLENKQITRKLCRLILEADYNNVTYVTQLNALTEELLRVKGYYRSQERISLCDSVIDEWLKTYRVS